MKLILERSPILVEYAPKTNELGVKQHYIEGVFMQAEKQNRNKRVYSKAILEKAVDKYVREQVKTNRAIGELDHPEGPAVNLDRVSHRIVSLEWKGNDVIGKALILNTPKGDVVKGMLEGGVQLGVSSRGMGSIVTREGVDYVDSDFFLSTVDIVQDPSAQDAFVNGIMEGVEWEKCGSTWVPKRIDKKNETGLTEDAKFNSLSMLLSRLITE